jgi:hypothetical protein
MTEANRKGDYMLVASPASSSTAPLQAEARGEPSSLSKALLWIGALVVVFVIPLAAALAAIYVSSFGIPLPVEVRVP